MTIFFLRYNHLVPPAADDNGQVAAQTFKFLLKSGDSSAIVWRLFSVASRVVGELVMSVRVILGRIN